MKQDQALAIMKTGANVFLTGEPGSGKTHTINQYIAYLRQNGVEPSITASTGIAATHIGGMTIHSWSGIGIRRSLSNYDLDKIASTEYLVKRIKRAKILIIDEVSMISAATLEMVEAVCRAIRSQSEPFGGLQVILVGDFFQLPPIVRTRETEAETIFDETEPGFGRADGFAFNSSAWRRGRFLTCYLSEQHRQSDIKYLELLSAIRAGEVTEYHSEILTKRRAAAESLDFDLPKLFTHNVNVDSLNERELAKLAGRPRSFRMSGKGREVLVATLKKSCLSPENLELKIGARVIFTKNNQRAGFINGTLGQVVDFEGFDNLPVVRTFDGRRVVAEPMEWTIDDSGKVLAQVTQVPLRLAWAITVHKSQGMSLDAAVMDLSAVFEYGQGYVALSRVRALEGLFLLGWNERTFQVHPIVAEADVAWRGQSSETGRLFGAMAESDLEKMQENFLRSCGVGKKNKPKTGRSKKIDKLAADNTYAETLAFWNEGKNLKQIAKTRGLKEGTVRTHLEKLAAEGKITKQSLAKIMNPKAVKDLTEILAMFHQLKTKSLTPVFEKFNGAYSYDDLRVVRLFLEDKKES
ncbi:MAG TPA: helix-turn-helix domain-containing protein [Candidatus Paceibacterota bacterium]|jgi:dephospho-CoA kinase|nr:helix-turn-helix domain-containing protein [Candidatus Paceibacterota bacterium]HQI25893.1 helix-turn-helix domain-containing protein [Candidatus Paceibacterota bacterium]HQJ84133.1 helix-turn-helix domain-containing protein [Candidatus Paceibacterota bacterium]